MDDFEEEVLKYCIYTKPGIFMVDEVSLERDFAGRPARQAAHNLARNAYLQSVVYKNIQSFSPLPKGVRHFWPTQKRMIYWVGENWLLLVSTLAAIVAAITGIIGLYVSFKNF